MDASYNLPVMLAGATACAGVAAQAVWAVVDDRLRTRRRRRNIAAGREAFRRKVAAVAAEARARSDTSLAWEGLRELRVSAVVDECHEVKSFYLAAADGRPLPRYQPGQFLTVHLPQATGGKPVVRCYTLSDRPREEFYRLSVKRATAPDSEPDAPPGVGSTILHDNVGVGDVLKAAAPRGDFFLQPVGDDPVVLIGAGIGVTPLVSMLAAQAHAGLKRETYVLLGMRSGEEHPFKQPLAELVASQPNIHQFVAYSQPGRVDTEFRDYQHRGRLDMDYVQSVLPSRDFRFYLCGPPGLMESLVPGLLSWGVADDQIHFEAFGPASVNRDDAATAARAALGAPVRFAASGKSAEWSDTDTTVLDVAQRLGVPMDAGCRVGNCGACAMRVIAGRTKTIRPAGAPCPDDHCLTCISVPTGPLELDA